MKRSSRRIQDDGKISLFPFLAVLLCMMGSLLVLLIIVSQRAQAAALEEQAAQQAAVPAKALADEKQVAQRLAVLQAHIANLRQARERLNAHLSSNRQTLSHLEDHTRRMRDEIERFRAEALLLARSQTSQSKSSSETVAEAKRVEALAEEAARLLKETEKSGAGNKPTYSVIPYDGPNPTRRRPIYLECQPDAVIIQPEGIVLRESDFEEPLGPDNPLAVALRAASEHLVRHAPDPAAGTPYPLLIVRPSSVRAYYAARAALESWGEDFGYEMVDEEWKIKYLPPDPQLADVLQSSVAVARRRMEFHRSASGYGHGRGTGFADGSEDGDQPGHEPGARRARSDRSHRGGGGGGAGQSQSDQVTGMGTEGGNGGGVGAGTQPGQGRTDPSVQHRSAAYPRSQPNMHSGSGSGGTGPGNHPSDSSAPDQGAPPQGPRLGESFVPEAGTTSGARAARPAGPSAGNGGSPGGGEPMGSTTPGAEGAQSLAKSRGKNWALPAASQGSVGVTRPLRIEVGSDRIIIDSGNPGVSPHEIQCTGPMEQSVEQFVSTVWDQMRAWGIAGRGMYWRPVLNLHVMPGGQQRAVELQGLLKGSGLDVKVQP